MTRLDVAGFQVGVVLLLAACSSVTSTPTPTASTPVIAGSSTLKPLNPAAVHTLVDRTVRELAIPAAVVLLRTPQGEFVAASGDPFGSTVAAGSIAKDLFALSCVECHNTEKVL